MNINSAVKKEITAELKVYKTKFKNSLKSEIRILDIISDFVHNKKRSEIIPVLTFLIRKNYGQVNEDTYSAAILIDLLYTATLIHDDVEDEPVEKHSLLRVNELWKSKLAVLMGDYFLAKGLLLSVKNKTHQLLEIVSNSVKEITEGELYKNYYSRSLNLNKEEYLNIIGKGLPSLLSACTSSAVIISGANEREIDLLKQFGYNMGMATQLTNELKQLNSNKKEEFIISFPLISAITVSSAEEKTEILSFLNCDKINKYRQIAEFIENKNARVETQKLISDYKSKALENISWMNDSSTRNSLNTMISAI